jgi:CheY-like chemotaxis protein
MRILLVEDDRGIARFVAKGLREQAYAVDVVGDGEEAGYKLSINDYDAVILDVMIPGRDGFEVCRDLRAAGIAVPVIMLTARDTVRDRITGLDSGADDYLTNPSQWRNCWQGCGHCFGAARLFVRRQSASPIWCSTRERSEQCETGARFRLRLKSMPCSSIWRVNKVA